MIRFIVLLLACCSIASCSIGSAGESTRSRNFKPTPHGKKLISYGSDWPNTAYVRQHIDEMEKHPFDGIVIGVSKSREPSLNGDTLGVKAWSKQKFDPRDYEPAVQDLKATKFHKFTDNFIQVESMPGDVDWFDDEAFSAVVNNFRILAHVAKAGACVGLEFDPEEYGDTHLFTYTAWPAEKRGGRTEAQYIEKARQRGQELMRGINAEFPGIKILFLFGPTLTAQQVKVGGHDYRLLAPFMEGMCQAADADSKIIDGYEQSYGYRIPLAFADARRSITGARDVFGDKAAFDRVMRVGFGLWIDNNSGKRGWFPDAPEKNHFQPATWQNAVNGALSYSDRYVWVWREKLELWANKNTSPAYEAAQAAGRKSATPVEVKRQPVAPATIKLLSATGPRDDASTFGDLLETNDVLMDLSTPGWEFWPDPKQLGAAKADAWSPIEVGQFWEEQGWDYDGVGWYRRSIDLQKAPTGKVQLAVGACDESAEVYLNGQRVGSHGNGETGWDERFTVDLSGKLKAGANELLIRVTDRTGPGGLWKGVKLLSAKPNEFVPSTKGKKLIEYGWDCPEPVYVRDHIREMEKRPFDGIVIRATYPSTQPGKRAPSIGRAVFGRKRFQPGQYEHNIENLKQVKFEKFTDNFIQVVTQPGDVDWFEPEWTSVLDNIRIMARIAKAGHCVGIMMDPEEYGSHKLWTYEEIPESTRQGRTLEQYRAKVRERGSEFMKVINSEFPNIKILCLLGPALTYGQQRADKGGYSLLAPFVEGMSAAADAGTEITDGFEQSYMYRTQTSFAQGRKDILAARNGFANPSLYDKAMRVGFGLWMDNGSNGPTGRPWDPTKFSTNYFQPDTWQSAIYYSLSYSDKYVWVYSEAFDWWTGKNFSPAYAAAQRAGRKAPGKEVVSQHPPMAAQAKFVKHAAGRGDEKAMAALMDGRKVLVDLSAGPWTFRLDPHNAGVREKWFSSDADPTQWSPIETGKFWEEQGWDYDGYGWYRSTVNLPATQSGKVGLLIGAADERATVWVNGQRVGTHNIGEYGWDQPFVLDVTDALKKGQNTIVIRVLDMSDAGGLWGSVKLVSGK
jgi:hypothetical protein